MTGARFLLPLLSSALLLAGCGRWRARAEAEGAVRAYDDALVVAYRTNDPAGLERVAGEKEVRKVTALIGLKVSSGLALESRLEEFELLDASPVGDDAMRVRTRERWRYWDRPLRPGMPAGTVYVADLWMAWDLERREGRWKVRAGRTERSDYLEPKGFRLGGGGPVAAGPGTVGAEGPR